MFRLSIFGIILLFSGLFSGHAFTATPPAKSSRPSFENDHFKLRLSPRTPNQIAAFYTGRGFPRQAIDALRQTCFITVGLGNKSKEIVWLDLSNWRFSTEDGDLPRYSRAHWKKRWAELGLEKRFQATFRWTLMPEALDFRPYEGEGGNIILPRTHKPITMTGSIAVGEKREKVYAVKIDNLMCASDP